MCAARAATDDARNHQPEAAPRAVRIDGLKGVLGARRPMAAILANEGFDRIAVKINGGFEQSLGDRHAFGTK